MHTQPSRVFNSRVIVLKAQYIDTNEESIVMVFAGFNITSVSAMKSTQVLLQGYIQWIIYFLVALIAFPLAAGIISI